MDVEKNEFLEVQPSACQQRELYMQVSGENDWGLVKVNNTGDVESCVWTLFDGDDVE